MHLYLLFSASRPSKATTVASGTHTKHSQNSLGRTFITQL